MSAVQTTPQYRSWENWTALNPCKRFAVYSDGKLPVDHFRTRSGAEYAARLLNDGLATVDAHALIGCRVVVK